MRLKQKGPRASLAEPLDWEKESDGLVVADIVWIVLPLMRCAHQV